MRRKTPRTPNPYRTLYRQYEEAQFTIEEILKVINQGSTILACNLAREAAQESIEGSEFLAVVLILLAQDMYLLELVYTLDKALKAHA